MRVPNDVQLNKFSDFQQKWDLKTDMFDLMIQKEMAINSTMEQ